MKMDPFSSTWSWCAVSWLIQRKGLGGCRCHWLWVGLLQLFLPAMAWCQTGDFAAEPPNVLVILTDDQGWGDLSLNGNSNLATPHIDSLAKDGARFQSFYVCPVCSPTRAEFLTGQYHPRVDIYSTSAGGERLKLGESTIADVFAKAGYATGAFGKWHNGMQYPYHPNGRGFEEFYGFCSGHWGDYFSPPLEHNGRLVPGNGFCADDFTNRAIDFMNASVQRGQPFFTYLAYNTPHSPMQVPGEYWERFEEKELALKNREPDREMLEHTRCALAMCENIDANVGRLLDKLETWKITRNTIVVYFCDNGPNGVRWNGGMKGRKGSTDEGGVRSPLLIRWPGSIPSGKKIIPVAAALDLLPTLAELSGISLESAVQQRLDGVSLKPLLAGEAHNPANWPDRLLFSTWNGRISVRSQRFRMDHLGQLYELESDPGQRQDVSNQFPGEVKRLKKAADLFRNEVLSKQTYSRQNDRRPFPLGHPDHLYTQLPARDATATGDIQRSNRFPNCSFFTNWTRTEETIHWPVNVGVEGRYEVKLHYTCPAKDIGSTIRLSCGGAELKTVLDQAHDPPLRGQENDRVKRIESYVKDFKEVTLGTIELPAGQHNLILSADSIPGEQVMDFRLLFFTRIEE